MHSQLLITSKSRMHDAVAFARRHHEEMCSTRLTDLVQYLTRQQVRKALQAIEDRPRQWNEMSAPREVHTGKLHLVHWMTGGSGQALDP